MYYCNIALVALLFCCVTVNPGAKRQERPKLKKHYVFHQNRWKSATFNENPCRKMQKTQKSWKSIGFIAFSPANVSKMNVLSTLRFKTLINIVLFWICWSKSGTFSENPCAKTQKTQKSEKTIGFIMNNCKKGEFCL